MEKRKTVQSRRPIGIGKRKIADRLLIERLFLEGEWRDPEFEAVLPEAVSDCGEQKLTPDDIEDIEARLTKLIDLGCNKKVLYWCLQQLSPEATRLREGEKRKTICYPDEGCNREVVIKAQMATRPDMVSIIKAVRRAESLIREYRSELLLVAELLPKLCPVPRGWDADDQPHAAEVMPDLLNSLRWVKGLAESWQAPNVPGDIKSKGILFLLVYVWIHSLEPTRPAKGESQSKRRRQTSPYILPSQIADAIANINIYYDLEGGHDAQDLQRKLKDFCTKRPDRFEKMKRLLKFLDEQAVKLPGNAKLAPSPRSPRKF